MSGSRDSANFNQVYVPLVKQEGRARFEENTEDLYKVLHKGPSVEIHSLDQITKKEGEGSIAGVRVGQLSRPGGSGADTRGASMGGGAHGVPPLQPPGASGTSRSPSGQGQRSAHSASIPRAQLRAADTRSDAGLGAGMAHITLSESDTPTSLTFARISGFCAFLNGKYIRQRNSPHNSRPTFRSEYRAPEAAGPAGGNFVYLFYHARNSAWVLGLMISESSGAAAYRKGQEALPSHPSQTKWAVSNKQGKFEALEGVVCLPGFTDAMVEAETQSSMPRSPLEPSTLVHPTGTSRTDAQRLLFAEASNHDGGHGAFVLRESTSVPDSFVLSVLLPGSRIEHILIKSEAGGYNLNGEKFRTLKMLVEHHEINPLQVGEDANPESVKLRKCVSGQNIYMSLADLGPNH